ncbi:MAG: hypothetical protein ACYCZR_03930 [Burkholderiales bacterium]
MGMYTEFHFNSALHSDVPTNVLEILDYMIGTDEFEPVITDPWSAQAELSQTPYWPIMLRCDSYYFDADTINTLRYDDIANQHYLCIRSNLKNYDDKIKKFIDWIMPYLDKYDGEFLGFSRYEESNEPTLIYAIKPKE